MYSKMGTIVVITIAVILGAFVAAVADDSYYYYDGQQIDITGKTCDTSVTITLPVGKGARIDAECIDPDPIEHVGVNAYRYRISDDWQELYGETAEDSTVTHLNENCGGLDIVVANPILKGSVGNAYITDEFFVRLTGDDISIDDFCVQYNLELVEKLDDAIDEMMLALLGQMSAKATGAFAERVSDMQAAIRSKTSGVYPTETNDYLVRVTSGTTGSTLSQANRVYEESGMVDCSAPDFHGMMLRSEHQEVVGPREGSGSSPKYWTDPAPFGHPADFIVELLKQTSKDTVSYGNGVVYIPGYYDATSIANAGDDNNNGSVDIDDVVFTVDHIFLGGPPAHWNRKDPNCAESWNIDDIVFMIQFLFSGGPHPKLSCCEWEI